MSSSSSLQPPIIFAIFNTNHTGLPLKLVQVWGTNSTIISTIDLNGYFDKFWQVMVKHVVKECHFLTCIELPHWPPALLQWIIHSILWPLWFFTSYPLVNLTRVTAVWSQLFDPRVTPWSLSPSEDKLPHNESRDFVLLHYTPVFLAHLLKHVFEIIFLSNWCH